MRKLIQRRLFDTSTATFVCEDGDETLYLKRTGEFFLHRRNVSDAHDGEVIVPILQSDAERWSKDHMPPDDYDAFFGPIYDDGTKSTLNLYLPNCLIEQVRREASDHRLSISAYIERRLYNDGFM